MELKKPRLLDLFCGAGGAAMGYHRAGFEVVGVDINPQKHYPFEFHQADAMTYPLDGFDAIHASPPCQHYSVTKSAPNCDGSKHPDLLPSTRARLLKQKAPWVVENVVGAPFGWHVTCQLNILLTNDSEHSNGIPVASQYSTKVLSHPEPL